MKRLSLLLVVGAFVIAGCGSKDRPAQPAPADKTPQAAAQAGKAYEAYEGAIWAADPVECGGDIICLINRADQCTPSRGKFIAEYRDGAQKVIRQNYEIGIQGTQFGQCQMYFKMATYSANGKAEKLPTMPIADLKLPHYQICRFEKGTDIGDLLRQGPKDSGSIYLGAGYLSGEGMFETAFDLNGTKKRSTFVQLAKQCYRHAFPDAERKITGVTYGLVAGESIENASADFRLTVDSINKDQNATFTIIAKDKRESVTLGTGEEKTVLGYKLKLAEKAFTEKNVSTTTTPALETLISFTLSLAY